MLEKLRAYLERPDHPDDTFLRLDSISLHEEELLLVLRVLDHGETETWSRWELAVHGVRDFRVEAPHGDLELHERGHVLARQFTDAHQSLYFRAAPDSALEVVGSLRAAHHSVADGWISFERYLNTQAELGRLLGSGDGLLANGPSFLIHEYARVLEGAGMRPHALDPRPLNVFSRGQFGPSDAPVAALILGQSYFVAERFDERELPAKEV